MQLLDFRMPPFSRLQWAGLEIKEKWEPKFNAARKFYQTLEKETVRHGIRKVTTEQFSSEMLDIKLKELNRNGLVFIPLRKVGLYNGRSDYHPPVVNGMPWGYYGVVSTRIEYAQEFADATETMNQQKMGELLGYPKCCIDFFDNTFKNNIFDPVWQQAENVSEKNKVVKEMKKVKEHLHIDWSTTQHLIRLKNIPWQSNSLLKNFQIGAIFHTSCSLDCPHTLGIAKQWFDLGKDIKCIGLDETRDFLTMPMEWDCLKGISYVRTPLFKASFNSNTSIDQYTVQIEGKFYPEDGVSGSVFPYTEKVYINFKNMLK